MPSQDTFSPTSAKSGEINKNGAVYTPDTATGTPKVSRDTALGGQEDRSFFSFDTSIIPDDAVITAVDFYWVINSTNAPPGVPSTWVTKFAVGTFIGAALDSSDWTGGTVVQAFSGTPSTQWIDLLAGGTSYVNRSGDTDVRIYDDSLWLAGGAWYHTIKKANTLLRVTYQLATIRNCRLFNCRLFNA